MLIDSVIIFNIEVFVGSGGVRHSPALESDSNMSMVNFWIFSSADHFKFWPGLKGTMSIHSELLDEEQQVA